MAILLLSSGSISSVIPIGSDGIVLAMPLDEFRHTMEWRTAVLKARDGTEQRHALMDRPRNRYEGLAVLPDDAALRAVRSDLFRRPASTYLMPLWHEAVVAESAFASTAIDVDTTYAELMVVGRRVLVSVPDGDSYTAVVQSITPPTPGDAVIVLDVAPSSTLPAGTMIVPLDHVTLDDQQGVDRYQVNAGEWDVSARATGAVYSPFLMGQGASLTTYASLPVVDRPPLNEEVVPEQEVGYVYALEYGALHAVVSTRDESDLLRTWEFPVDQPADRQWWKKFLATVVGQQKPFLLPTWRPDFPTPITPSGLTVEYPDDEGFTYADFETSSAHQRVMITYTDGTHAFRTIVDYAVAAGVEQITLDDVADPSALGIARMCFLETVRLNEDAVELDYDGDTGIGTVTITARVIQGG